MLETISVKGWLTATYYHASKLFTVVADDVPTVLTVQEINVFHCAAERWRLVMLGCSADVSTTSSWCLLLLLISTAGSKWRRRWLKYGMKAANNGQSFWNSSAELEASEEKLVEQYLSAADLVRATLGGMHHSVVYQGANALQVVLDMHDELKERDLLYVKIVS